MALTNSEAFTFTAFVSYTNAAEVTQSKYALILRNIFEYVNSVYEIDFDTLLDIPFDLQLAVFEHAKWVYEVSDKSANLVASVTDSNGSKVTYKVTMPTIITRTYERYSVAPLAVV